MLDFSLTEDQRMLVDMTRDFAAREIRPKAEEYHENHTFPAEILQKAFDLGLVNIGLSQEYGGSGMGPMEVVLIAEILGQACPGIASCLLINEMSIGPLEVLGTVEQKQKWLNLIGRERLLVSFALTEPQSGSDIASLKTSYVKKGDRYILNGKKAWISNATKAQLFVVLAYPQGVQNISQLSAFIVPAKTPGVILGKPERKLGLRAGDTASITFEDVEIPAENLLGREGDGMKGAMRTFMKGRTGTAAIATGIQQRCVDECIEYSRTRYSGGKPIGDNPVIRQYIAQMQMDTECSRLAVWRAAWKWAQGEPFLYEASLAKAYATSTAEEVTLKAVQIMASAGVSLEYPIGKLVDDAKVLCIAEGTTEIQKVTLSEILYSKGCPPYFT